MNDFIINSRQECRAYYLVKINNYFNQSTCLCPIEDDFSFGGACKNQYSNATDGYYYSVGI